MSSVGQRLKIILAAVVVFQFVAWGVSVFFNLPVRMTTSIAAVVAFAVGMFIVRKVGG